MDPSPVHDQASAPPAPAGLAALLSNVIDYAGLFPPARLDMEATVRNYAAYVEGGHAWMLERLIVPVPRLDEFEELAGGLLPTGADAVPWPIAALTAAAGDDSLGADLDRIAAFNQRHLRPASGQALIDVVEMKADTARAVDRGLDLVPDELFPYVEIPVASDPRGHLAALAGSEAGAKIRTGGVTADLFPSSSEVARFLEACAGADVPLKATAGLHHPLRRRSAGTGSMEHGFLNFLVAAVLVRTRGLDAGEIVRILEETVPTAFTFDGDGLGWGGHQASVEEIEDARLSFAGSFGSCSFDEPRVELEGMGLLS